MEHLEVLDSRTGKSYKIPIDNGYIRAADISKINVQERGLENGNGDENEPKITRGLRIHDAGYENTSCVESSITFM
jgi:citrate synthase